MPQPTPVEAAAQSRARQLNVATVVLIVVSWVQSCKAIGTAISYSPYGWVRFVMAAAWVTGTVLVARKAREAARAAGRKPPTFWVWFLVLIVVTAGIAVLVAVLLAAILPSVGKVLLELLGGLATVR